jgi:hypothetical protein
VLRKLFVDDINKLIGIPPPFVATLPLAAFRACVSYVPKTVLLYPLERARSKYFTFHVCLNGGALSHMKHAGRHTVDLFESMRFICAEIATHICVEI